MSYTFRHIQKVTLIQTCLSTFVHISEDSDIFRILVLPVPKTSTCSSSQVLLVFPCSNLFGTFFHFCFKSNHSTFFLKDSLSITTITIIISCNMRLLITHTTLTTYLIHTTHVSLPPTPMSTTQPTLSRYPHHPRNPRLHITHTSMLPTQERHSRHLRAYEIHATHSSTNRMPFSKLYYEGYDSSCQIFIKSSYCIYTVTLDLSGLVFSGTG